MEGSPIVAQAIARAFRDGARLRYQSLERCGAEIAKAAGLIVEALRTGHKVLAFGNGGSAADAQHIAAELVGRFVLERAPLPGIALTTDTSALTAIANDYGFDQIFARQLQALGAPGDVAIAITTSGTSPNVLKAIEVARTKGIAVIGMTSAKGAAFADLCDACVVVPTRETARVQEIHITVGHVLCEAVDLMLHPSSDAVAVPELGPEKIVTREELVALRERYRRDGRTVVWTNGMFDVIHAGHVASLRAASREGDVLVVGVNADATVRAAKGEGRPVFPASERAEMLAALEVVDHVVVFAEPTPSEILAAVRPDVHCKGADYAPPNGAPMPEAEIVRGYGGRIAFLPLVAGRSTTSTLERLRGSER